MPYIPEKERRPIDTVLADLIKYVRTPGQFNYVISRLLEHFVWTDSAGVGYAAMSRWRAAVTDAAEEFYRRVMAPYEDRKAKENGDVYRRLTYSSRFHSEED